jgi:hypothetical protein
MGMEPEPTHIRQANAMKMQPGLSARCALRKSLAGPWVWAPSATESNSTSNAPRNDASSPTMTIALSLVWSGIAGAYLGDTPDFSMAEILTWIKPGDCESKRTRRRIRSRSMVAAMIWAAGSF